MDWIKLTGFIVGLLSVAASILAFAYKYGKSQESVLQKMTSIEESLKSLSESMHRHMADSSIHVNEKLQDRIDRERTQFQAETKSKLEEITRRIYSLGTKSDG